MTWWQKFFINNNKKEKTRGEICRETSPGFIEEIEAEEFWYNPLSKVHWWQRTWICPGRILSHKEVWEVYYMDLESTTWKYQVIDATIYRSMEKSNRLDPNLIGGGSWLIHETQIGKQ
tara:strand:- start:1211 stop:1564 length:354 start_codon:yes stop_codon:yes gene_type:complete